MPEIAELIKTVLGSAALFTFIQFLLQRYWSKKDKTVVILDRLDKIEYGLGANKADVSRRRILAFNSEILKGEKHTREDFEDVLKDIDEYERFCKANPSYPNTRAVMAEQNIKDTYKKAMDERDFL